MVSATFELGLLALSWTNTFSFDGENYVRTGSLFSNSFRYMNWSIDVPVLLTQLLIVGGITGTVFLRRWLFADITSKAVWGVLLAIIAQKVSAAGGYKPSIASSFWLSKEETNVAELWLLDMIPSHRSVCGRRVVPQRRANRSVAHRGAHRGPWIRQRWSEEDKPVHRAGGHADSRRALWNMEVAWISRI